MNEAPKEPGYWQKLQAFMRSKLQGATGQIPGRVIGKGAAADMKAARAKLPLFLQVFGVLPCFDPSMSKRQLHARKPQPGRHNHQDQYKDIDGNWQPFPKAPHVSKKGRKLGFRGSWRSSSLKPGRDLKREHAARFRAKLETGCSYDAKSV